MAEDLESRLSMTEDVETLELENVWTTGKKFLISISVAISLLIATGVVFIVYINEILKTHKEVVEHTFAFKEHGLVLNSELNRHKAAISSYSLTRDEATKTQVTDIRSKLV